MAFKTKVLFEGQLVDAEELDFEILKDDWAEYSCEDGTTLRIKVALSKVIRLIGKKNGRGEPVFILDSTNILATRIPLEKYAYEKDKDAPPEPQG